MSKEAIRTHIVIPEDLINEVDRLAGRRKRSRFVEDAIREKLAREALSDALATSAGSLSPSDYPEWNSPAAISAWVKHGRREDDARLARKVHAAGD